MRERPQLCGGGVHQRFTDWGPNPHPLSRAGVRALQLREQTLPSFVEVSVTPAPPLSQCWEVAEGCARQGFESEGAILPHFPALTEPSRCGGFCFLQRECVCVWGGIHSGRELQQAGWPRGGGEGWRAPHSGHCCLLGFLPAGPDLRSPTGRLLPTPEYGGEPALPRGGSSLLSTGVGHSTGRPASLLQGRFGRAPLLRRGVDRVG